MTKHLSDEIGKNYPPDIIDYFYDYGIDFLYDLHYKKKKNDEKNIENGINGNDKGCCTWMI